MYRYGLVEVHSPRRKTYVALLHDGHWKIICLALKIVVAQLTTPRSRKGREMSTSQFDITVRGI